MPVTTLFASFWNASWISRSFRTSVVGDSAKICRFSWLVGCP